MGERQRDERTYIKVHDGLPDHPKVEGLSDRAFRLLVETWCWCSRHLTDGRVPSASWRKRGTAAARRELVDAELAEDHGRYVLMHDYLEHQRSAEEVAERVEQKRRAGARGNHNRWHMGPKGKPDPDCEWCIKESHPRSQVRSHPPSQTRSQKVSQNDRETSPETEGLLRNPQVETDSPLVTLGGDRPVSDRAGARNGAPPTTLTSENRPAEHCTEHFDVAGDPGPCRGCAKAREHAEQWDRDTERARIAANRACTWCDTDGWRIDPANRHRGPLSGRCDHTPMSAEQLEELADA